MSRRSDPHPRTRRATAALALSALLALAGCMDAMGPGLLSGGGAPGTIEDSAPGAALPLGQLARACGVSGRALGRQVAAYPENRPRYRLYDSAPGTAAAHSFYVTGFDDGCARRFTAALAVFGPPAMHEQLRYGLPATVQPYSTTDRAYETVKSRVCGVARKKPCGGRIGRLEKDTVFLSIYERYGTASRWANLLLHDGAVMAQDVKGG